MKTSEPPKPVCVECGAVAPDTDTAYTLIGQRFAWRLVHVVDEQGRRIPQWRCDKCWRRAKAVPKPD